MAILTSVANAKFSPDKYGAPEDLMGNLLRGDLLINTSGTVYGGTPGQYLNKSLRKAPRNTS